MADTTTEEGGVHEQRFQVRATSDSHFSWIRTRLSIERTMMSAVRTAVALIGFGFTIVQFFERFNEFAGVDPAERPNAARYIGLLLIGAGVVVLLISAWQYRFMLSYLWQDYPTIRGVSRAPHRTPVLAITIGMIFVGLFAFLSVFFRAV